MPIRFKPDDYIVIDNNGSFVYGMASAQKNKILPEINPESDDAELMEFDPKNVVANLGKRPRRGQSVFGLTIDPYEFPLVDEKWGTIHFYMDFKSKDGKEDRQLRTFKKVLKTAYEKLKAIDATLFLPTTIRVKQGKKSATSVEAGSYTHLKNGDDHIKIVPIDFTDHELTEYCLLHESAHGIWFQQVPHDVKVDWMELYKERNQVISYDNKRLKELAKRLTKHEGGFTDFEKQLDDDSGEKEILKEVFKYILRVHNLKKNEVESYVRNRGSVEILKFWPKATDISVRKADITEYASKSYEEFFAEALTHHMIGNKLPRDVRKLIKKTLKVLIRHK